METLFIALGALVFYLIAYHTYGRWLARKIFRLDKHALVPSVALKDNQDYVPTSKTVIFGHHFTSIAGTGPIVGPALAVIWGWVPALLWVLLGSVFIGALHDFGSLVVSMRNRGQTVGDIAGRVLAPRTRILFLSILFLALTIVLAIFGLVIAAVFKLFPASIFPCLVQIPLSVAIGVWLHRRGANLIIPSLLVLAMMYFSVFLGNTGPIGAFNAWSSKWSTMDWVAFLLIYSYVASVLPVWTLLQPRDYINSLQLLSILALLVIGLFIAGLVGGAPFSVDGARPVLEIVAAPIDYHPTGAPWLFPFLFVTIACGAISGFHCLVSSGTSSKQIRCESDAQFVGYGSMLTEGFLAVLVILACVAGISLGIAGPDGSVVTGKAAFALRYENWTAMSGLGPSVGAFVEGSANFLKALGIAPAFAVALMGVFVASFAATTMDTACRLQRYVIQELASTFAPKISKTALAAEAYDFDDNRAGANRKTGEARDHKPHALNPLTWLTNKHGATIFAVILAGIIAAVPSGVPWSEWSWSTAGKGGMLLWPLFGATNQLLGGFAFLVICFWMWRRGLPIWFVVIPMVFMLIIPAVALFLNIFVGEFSYIAQKKWLLLAFGLVTLVLEIWMICEAVIAWPKARGVLEQQLEPLPTSGVFAEGGRSS